MIESIIVAPHTSLNQVHTFEDEIGPQLEPEEYGQRGLEQRFITNPKVSVIFVARNENEWIRKAVESLYAAKNEASFECIVYDDGSTDDSCTFFPVTKLLTSRKEPIGPSRARNWGAMAARGEILIFCDGHLKFHDGWIDGMIKHIEDDRCDVVNPIISDIAFPTTKGYGWSFDTTSYEYKWGEVCNGFQYRGGMAGGCFAIKRSVFMRVGMFDKAFTKWGMEDSELALRLSLSGYRIGVEPAVDVGHFFKESNSYGVDWFSYNYNFLRMAYVNMDQQGLQGSSSVHPCYSG
jgi:glycosyltransferase involved in cell wall biosynthesis